MDKKNVYQVVIVNADNHTVSWMIEAPNMAAAVSKAQEEAKTTNDPISFSKVVTIDFSV